MQHQEVTLKIDSDSTADDEKLLWIKVNISIRHSYLIKMKLVVPQFGFQISVWKI
jgi:hypothetical protein